jgi:hypothetical protein
VPTEEGISGFSAAFALFSKALPGAAHLDAQRIASAARAIDLPTSGSGGLPNATAWCARHLRDRSGRDGAGGCVIG